MRRKDAAAESHSCRGVGYSNGETRKRQGEGSAMATNTGNKGQERIRLQARGVMAKAKEVGRLANALHAVCEMRGKKGDAARHQPSSTNDGSKGNASNVRRMPTIAAIIAVTATKRKRDQLKIDAEVKQAKKAEPQAENTQCTHGGKREREYASH